MTEVLAIIPARGGSKGIPRKNIRSFAGLSADRIFHRRRLAGEDSHARHRLDR